MNDVSAAACAALRAPTDGDGAARGAEALAAALRAPGGRRGRSRLSLGAASGTAAGAPVSKSTTAGGSAAPRTPAAKRRRTTGAGGSADASTVEEDLDEDSDSEDEEYVPGAVEQRQQEVVDAADDREVIVLDGDSSDDFEEVKTPPRRRQPTKAKAAKKKAKPKGKGRGKGTTLEGVGSPEKPIVIDDDDSGEGEEDMDPQGLSTCLNGDLVAPDAVVELASQPKDVLMPLLPFQREFLSWALRQERGPVKGGILADEMGMGKTVQAISVVMADREAALAARAAQAAAQASRKGKEKEMDPATTKVGPTLVVCPTVAIIQWRGEIARYVAPGAAKVLVWHGQKKTADAEELMSADFVLTTYGTLEALYRKHLMPEKVKCQWCSKKFHPEKLKVHLTYFCGPTAERTEAQAKQARKNPSSWGKLLRDDAAKEKAKVAKAEAKAAKASGRPPKRPPAPAEAKTKGKGKKRKSDEVSDDEDEESESESEEETEGDKAVKALIAAAMTVAEKAKNEVGSKRADSALHAIHWHRVILDEAHAIKDRSCNTAQACFMLEANYRWALSGTPLQNRVGELYSIVRFLRSDPYSYYFCRTCGSAKNQKAGKKPCKTLWDMDATGHCRCCGCHKSRHSAWWNTKIANPIKKFGYTGAGADAMNLLRNKVLAETLLRRTKQQRADDLALPPRQMVVKKLKLDSREKDFYEALWTKSQANFGDFVKEGTVLNNYAHIFDLLVRLRQAVCHPYLCIYPPGRPADKAAGKAITDTPAPLCGICFDAADDAVTTACGHQFCRACIGAELEKAAAPGAPPAACPTCREPLSVDLSGGAAAGGSGAAAAAAASSARARRSIMARIGADRERFVSSTKIEALREELFEMKRKDPSAKAIVFSQFTSMLELMEYRLGQAGLECVRLDGSMSLKKRDVVIQRFTDDPDVSVFFLSLKAGGVALNLTAASQVFLMDPWWNPAIEQQANDRIHRMGQYKAIRCVRIVIAGSIEERIIALQEKKRLIFESTVGANNEAVGKLTADDMRFLFS